MRPSRIIDIHTHIAGDSTDVRERSGDRQFLLEMADRFNIEAMVVIPLWFGDAHPSPKEIQIGNDAVHDFARQDPRVLPFVTVYPPHGERAIGEMRRRIEDENFTGLKVWLSLADQPFMNPLIERMIEYDRPTLIHALNKAEKHPVLPGGQYPLESRPSHIARLATRYPQAKIIMAHIGGDFLWSCDVIRECANVWTDISGSYCETGMVEHAVETLGAHRVLFGSDAPGASLINNIAKVMAADISTQDKNKIMYQNAKSLLG